MIICISNIQYALSLLEDLCVCSDHFLAHTVKPGNKIAIWNFHHQYEEPAYLVGHHLKITAIALANQEHGRFLCSCSDDNIILWDLLQNGGKPNRGKVLLSNIDKPSCCCYSSDDSKLLICISKALLVFDLKSMTYVTVEGRLNRIHLCALTWDNSFLTVDENTLCKLWNLPALEVVNKKYITPSFPSAIAVEQRNKLIAIGTTSGNLYFFSDDFSLIRSIQIWRILKNFEKRRNHVQDVNSDENSIYGNESSIPVIAMNFYSHKSSNENSDLFLPEVICIAIATTSSFFLFNVNTEEIIFYVNFTEKNILDGNNEFGLVQSAIIYSDDCNHVIHIILIPLVGNSIILLKIMNTDDPVECVTESMRCINITGNSCEKNKTECSKCDPLSFLSGCKLSVGHSFLMHKKTHLLGRHPSSLKSGLPSSSSSLCQPISFHKKIKSSGYGLVNKCVMFQPKTNSKKSQPTSKGSKYHGASKLLSSAMCDISNVFSNEKPGVLSTVAFNHAPVVTSSHIAGNGQHALCALNDGSVVVLRIGKKSMKQISTICCHNQSVTSVRWSHSMDVIMTSGADRMVKLWRWAKQKCEPVLVVNKNNCKKSNLVLNGSPKTGELFPDVVTNAQFYYIDQFLLIACKNALYMFEYNVNSRKTDLVRYEKNLSKLVVKVHLSSQRITAIAGVNQFYSNLVLCAGSCKCLDVCDMNTGTVAWHADDVSIKPPYLIALNEGSPNASQPPSMYDIFMTSALFDGIKLWDLRTKRCVLCYKEHQSSSVHCGGAFSACGRYIAAGSEDKSIYIYDLRSTSSLHRLTDSTDVITNVLFSPIQPQLLASSITGKVYLYGQAFST